MSGDVRKSPEERRDEEKGVEGSGWRVTFVEHARGSAARAYPESETYERVLR